MKIFVLSLIAAMVLVGCSAYTQSTATVEQVLITADGTFCAVRYTTPYGVNRAEPSGDDHLLLCKQLRVGNTVGIRHQNGNIYIDWSRT